MSHPGSTLPAAPSHGALARESNSAPGRGALRLQLYQPKRMRFFTPASPDCVESQCHGIRCITRPFKQWLLEREPVKAFAHGAPGPRGLPAFCSGRRETILGCFSPQGFDRG